jgi:hypothetical protein
MGKLSERRKAARARLKREPAEAPELAELLDVPELFMCELTGRERDAHEASLWPDGAKVACLTNVRARLVARCLVDESGQRVVLEDDVEALGELSGALLDRLYDQARRLSGLRAGDVEASQEALRKNAPGSSGTPSPAASDAPTGS